MSEVFLGTNNMVDATFLNPGSKHRIWMVEQDDEAPLAVVAGVLSESDIAWFDTAEDARVFDIVGAQGSMMVTWDPDSDSDPGLGWFLSSRSRVWLVEHPDRGLLIVTAGAFDNVEESFPLILANAEQMLDSLEFIDLE